VPGKGEKKKARRNRAEIMWQKVLLRKRGPNMRRRRKGKRFVRTDSSRQGKKGALKEELARSLEERLPSQTRAHRGGSPGRLPAKWGPSPRGASGFLQGGTSGPASGTPSHGGNSTDLRRAITQA